MKKLLLFILAIILTGIFCSYAETENYQYFPDMGFSIAIPSDAICITRDNYLSNAIMESFGENSATIYDYMLENEIYLWCVFPDSGYEISISSHENSGDLVFYNDMLKEIFAERKKTQYEELGFSDISVDIIEDERFTGACIHYTVNDGNLHPYVMYELYHEDKLVLINLNSLNAAALQNGEIQAQKMVDSIVWGIVEDESINSQNYEDENVRIAEMSYQLGVRSYDAGKLNAAADYFKEAAELGHLDAQNRLDSMVLHNEVIFTSVPAEKNAQGNGYTKGDYSYEAAWNEFLSDNLLNANGQRLDKISSGKEGTITIQSIIPKYSVLMPGEKAPTHLICEYENRYHLKQWAYISLDDYLALFAEEDDAVNNYLNGKRFPEVVKLNCLEASADDISDGLSELLNENKVFVIISEGRMQIKENNAHSGNDNWNLETLYGSGWKSDSNMDYKDGYCTMISIVPRYTVALPGEKTPSYLICRYENKYHLKLWAYISIADYISLAAGENGNSEDYTKGISFSDNQRLKSHEVPADDICDGLHGVIGQDKIFVIDLE